MAVAYPTSMPSTPGVTKSKFGLRTNVDVFESKFTGTVQTRERQGARWVGEYSVVQMTRAQAAAWTAFLTSLNGPAGTFYGFDPDAKTPLGVGTGSPLVKGASQTGTTLLTDGWTADQAIIMQAGDYFEVASRLYMVITNAASDGSGDATLQISPQLRESPTNNAVITVSNPKVKMRLLTNNESRWDSNEMSLYGINFVGVESL